MKKTHLYILWTNGSPVTAEMMVFMYAINSLRKGWWEEVTVIIWGEPAQLICEHRGVQTKIREALDAGVHLSACRACADQLGATATLEELGIAVEYWGQPLTDLLQSDEKLLTI